MAKKALKTRRKPSSRSSKPASPRNAPGRRPNATARALDRRARPRLLSGGNPQIPKSEGEAPVRAYIAAIPPGWKRDTARRLDALITRTVPPSARLRKAVKWNSPFYGIAGQGWFLSFHCFTNYIKVAFFKGSSLRPIPPGDSKSKDTRYLDIHQHDWGNTFSEAQIARWVKQASKLPGWSGGR